MEDNIQDENNVEFNSRIDLTKLQDSVAKVKLELGM